MKSYRLAAGVLIWLVILIGVWAWRTPSKPPQTEGRVVADLTQFMLSPQTRVSLEDNGLTHRGIPIFLIEGPNNARQVGEVLRGSSSESPTGEALFYASAPSISPDARLVYHRTPDSMEWILATLLPPEKRQLVAAEMASAFESHHQEIIAELQPIIQDAMAEAFVVVEQDLQVSIEAHRPELKALGEKYQTEIIEKEFVPLVKTEIWPVVRLHGEPVATEVGKELWNKVSLWRFGWRLAYDRSILPDRKLTEKEWQRFLENDAVPILEAHIPDFIELQKLILADVSKNETVKSTIRASITKVANDPELQRIIWQIIREVIIDNPRLKTVFKTHWESDRAKQAFRLTAARLEPSVTRIGRIIAGSRDESLTPEFTRILRNQVLNKDKTWLVLENPSTSGTPPSSLQVIRGKENSPNPFLVDRRNAVAESSP